MARERSEPKDDWASVDFMERHFTDTQLTRMRRWSRGGDVLGEFSCFWDGQNRHVKFHFSEYESFIRFLCEFA